MISYSTRIQCGHKALEVVGSAYICNRNCRTPQKGGSFFYSGNNFSCQQWVDYRLSMYITHILPERKCCESYQGSNRLAIGHKPLPLRHSRNWRLHLMTSQLICLKIDVNGQKHDVKVHNLDNLFCQFVHLLLMKIWLNNEGTRL